MRNLAELSQVLSSSDCLITDSDIIESYRYDRSNAEAGMPIAVVRARNTDDVRHTLKWANENKIAVVTRGAGTSLAGCGLAIDNGIVLTTELMTQLSIDPVRMVAHVEPGVINKTLKSEAKKYGLYYPPDPSSFEISSIGGNIATNAGGICCVKYGVTRDYVLALEVVIPSGELLKLGSENIKDVAGYDLKSLFVGSEGTLGVITNAVLKLVPLGPDPVTVVCYFKSLEAASYAIWDLRKKFNLAALELMDKRSIWAVEKLLKMGLDLESDAMVILRSEQTSSAKTDEVNRIINTLKKYEIKDLYHTEDFQEGEMFMTARRQAIPAVEKDGPVLIEDVGVPIANIAKLLRKIEEISVKYDLNIATIGHAGDGNFHPLIPFEPGKLENSVSMKAFGEIMDVAIELDGTITGEHGVGTLKKPWLNKQIHPNVVSIMKQIKTVFDPNNILNPDKVF